MPGTLNDEKFATLRMLGYSGSMGDMTLQFLREHGAPNANTASDGWLQALSALGFTGGYNTAFDAFLTDRGYTGSLSDKQRDWWRSGAPVDPPPAGTNVFTSESLDGGYFWGFDATGGALVPTTLANHPGADITILRAVTGGPLCMIRHDQVPEAGSSILFAIPGYRFTFANTGSDYTLQSNTLSAWFATGPVAVDVALIYVPA